MMTSPRSLRMVIVLSCSAVLAQDATPPQKPIPNVAAVTTIYSHNSHADLILGRFFEGNNLDGREPRPKMKLVSLFVDQFHDAPPHLKDKSRELAAKHGFRLSPSISDALTLGTDKLAVDGILLLAEHGEYPVSDTGQTVYPKRRVFGEIIKVCEASGRTVPLFFDKHLADNWADAKAHFDTAKRLRMPLMAGSSIPVTWRNPAVDVPRGAKLKQIVATSYHTLDAYGFHALEMVQCLAEQRAGGETGIAAVQCLTDAEVWKAESRGIYDRKLLDLALTHLKWTKIPAGQRVEDLAPNPVLWVIDYRDGLRANIFTLNGAVGDWCVAWNYADNDRSDSTHFEMQQFLPFAHFTPQLEGIERMLQTNQPTWPAERTLLTSGLLDELLLSKKNGSSRRNTPHLAITYQTDWRWRQLPPIPPERKSEVR